MLERTSTDTPRAVVPMTTAILFPASRASHAVLAARTGQRYFRALCDKGARVIDYQLPLVICGRFFSIGRISLMWCMAPQQ